MEQKWAFRELWIYLSFLQHITITSRLLWALRHIKGQFDKSVCCFFSETLSKGPMFTPYIYIIIISMIISRSPDPDIQRRFTRCPNFSGIRVVNREWKKDLMDSTYLQKSSLNVSWSAREREEWKIKNERGEVTEIAEDHWTELNWTELNWTELNWTELGTNCFTLRRLLWQIPTLCSVECAEKLITQTAGFESSVCERERSEK